MNGMEFELNLWSGKPTPPFKKKIKIIFFHSGIDGGIKKVL